MATWTTYDASATNARDVTDAVEIVSPKDTPLFSMIGSNKASARRKERVTDALASANAGNALVEGGTLSDDTLTARAIEFNDMQIFKKVINISGTQEEVAKYGGITSEIKAQVIKAYTELGTDVEKALFQGTSATGTTAVARKLSGLVEKITTNTATAVATGATWTGTGTADYAAYESLLTDLLEIGYNTGTIFDHVFVGGTQKRRISKLTDKVTRQIMAEDKVQVNVVNLYDSDFGTVKIILDRYVPSTNIIAIQKDKLEISYLRRFMQMPLAKTTDSERIAIVGELTLDMATEKAGGKITAS